jgi:fused signal recognition particle receptor
MSLFDRFKTGLAKTHNRLVHEIKRIATSSPKLDAATLEELEMALLGADFGVQMTEKILGTARQSFETQGRDGAGLLEVAAREVEASFEGADPALRPAADGLTVVSMVGVNGTGKTTTAAKLAHRFQSDGQGAMLGACDTFRAAAIDQLKLWGERLGVEVVAGAYGADPAAVAHDAVTAAQARKAQILFIDTAGRLHTKHNLMQELQKLHRVIGKQLPGAPHEVLLVVDATTGLNALQQAREFHKIVPLTGLVVTKLDGTSKGGVVVAIHDELKLPVKFIGLGEQAEDLQPFDAPQFARALFEG